MKRTVLAIIALCGALCSFAQDSTSKERVDTIKVGGMIIIKKTDKNGKPDRDIVISNRRRRNPNISTNWWIVDLGFANLNDKTNYASAEAQAFAPGFGKDQFDLRTKSINVNIWFFMQRLNIVKHALNLKYGLGLELNNYMFDDKRVRFQKNPTLLTLDPALADVKKNKLAADYITVPLMLNINFTPGRNKGFGLSGGISAGYLYSSRQKIKDNGKKTKLKDDFDLEKWKLSYVGELNLGPVKLYGSYAFKSMWEKGLDQTPYNVGIRLSNW
ncbi:MAG TPA: outer membrane beta-barrel protein [Flavisolibacter sp.]|jgi:hypothetical protein|nr:outer membrane beta-barrel protein [Flavisolibacter sp.]